MDELLDLMEEEERRSANESHPPQSDNNENDDGMDELLDLMDEHYDKENNENNQSQSMSSAKVTAPESSQQAQIVTPPPNNSLRRPKARAQSSSQQPAQRTTKAKAVSAGIDDKLGIRMVERKVSSVDLLDMISINPYHTPATLSAMNLSSLSRLLMDPPIRVDAATVTGKMNMATVGIVFSNSGTRLSAKGGAFCILDIGNFVSGPCVTVMLFGDLYSKYVRTCVPGKVVAVVNPSLLPLRAGGKTRIAVTVNNSNQFHLVAKAVDFAICKGTTRVKGSDGKWTAGGNCKKWVDKRVCEFCEHHRKQKDKKSKATNAVGGSLHQLRAEGKIAVASSRFGTMNRGRFAAVGAGDNNSLTDGLQAVPMKMKKTLAEQRTSIVIQQRQKMNGKNRFLNSRTSKQMGNGVNSFVQQQPEPSVSQTQRVNRLGVIPRQMKSKSLENVSNTANPYSKRSNPVPAQKPKPKTGIVGNAALRGDGDWFQQATKPRQANSRSGSMARAGTKGKKRRAINTDGGGFDGSVQVPKPSRLFAGGQRQMLSDARGPTMPDRSKSSTSIMESQAAIARMMQLAKDDDSKCRGNGKARAPSKKVAPSSKSSFYASVGDVDLEKVKNSKSKFAREVEAEEYAKSRQKVVELEKLEGSKQASKKRQANNETKSFTVEYFCKSCGTYSVCPPKSCMNANHQVVKRRKLAEQQSKEAKRTKLHQKGAGDGGLRLGAGNEWARNLKDFHS